jgi:Ca2+-transporting ATPase
MPVEACLERLHTTRDGLGTTEVAQRSSRHGYNEIKEGKQRTAFQIFVSQFTDFMIWILIAAAAISGIIGEPIDAIAIIVIVLLNALVGFIQEYRAQKAVKALRKMAEPNTTVKRSGTIQTIPATSIVPGDIVILEAGNIVPADMRIIESAQLNINESPLTGESTVVEKQTPVLEEKTTTLADRKNMAYKGTMVTHGHGIGVVVATGMNTELGAIATMLQTTEETKTPLQRRLTTFSKKLAVGFLVICVIVFVTGILRNVEPSLMLLTAVSLAVAAIPEALPAVITIALAKGAKTLAQAHALMRKLAAVETLGSITCICSDKTGTLTKNKMTVMQVYTNDQNLDLSDNIQPVEAMPDLLEAMALNNDSRITEDGELIGDPTEIALYTLAQRTGFDKFKLEINHPRIGEIPFDSQRKLMTTFHRMRDDAIVQYTKGAVESLTQKATGIFIDGVVVKDLKPLQEAHNNMAKNGLRILGIGMKKWKQMPALTDPDAVEKDLIILGLVGMIDPPREEIRDAIQLCKTAGIVPVMITGDHPITAWTIARELGIFEDTVHTIMTGTQMNAISDEEFMKQVERIRVYARVAPEQKLKIVNALQRSNQYVAMTGDGVNDAPALKTANIGIAMGVTGTEVSKEAAHMILLDDNFATIVRAIQEGRRIFDNIRKFIKYILSCNMAEIWAIFGAPFFGLPIPLLPIQILWINLVTDSMPALALAAEPHEHDIMHRPPRPPQEGLLARGLGTYIAVVGLLMAGITLAVQFWALSTGRHWQTLAFTVLCFCELGNAFAVRSERATVLAKGVFTNLQLVGALVIVFLLQLSTIYLPFMNIIFKTTPLSLFELGVSIAIALVFFILLELWKIITRKRA